MFRESDCNLVILSVFQQIRLNLCERNNTDKIEFDQTQMDSSFCCDLFGKTHGLSFQILTILDYLKIIFL